MKSDEFELETARGDEFFEASETSNVDNREQSGARLGRRSPRTGFFADRWVRIITLISAIVLILYLITLISALTMGFIGNETPRTAFEQELAVARQAYENREPNPEAFATYAVLMAKDGQFTRAHQILKEGIDADIEDPQRQWLTLATAQVNLMEGNYEGAIAQAENVRAALTAQFEKDREAQLTTGKPTYLIAEFGRGLNYYKSLLVQTEAHEKLGQLESALETIGLYLKYNAGAADVWEWKGDLLLKTNDSAGALEAYKEALRFVPDNAELEEKISRTGSEVQSGE